MHAYTQSTSLVCFEYPVTVLCKCQNYIKQVYSTNSIAWVQYSLVLRLHTFIIPDIELMCNLHINAIFYQTVAPMM